MSEAAKHLLPCPFCGGDAEVRSNHSSGAAWVQCRGCLAQTGGFQEWNMPDHLLREHALREWNSRAAHAPTMKGDIDEFMRRLGPRWFLEQGWFPASVAPRAESTLPADRKE